jgi:hypothetical protein
VAALAHQPFLDGYLKGRKYYELGSDSEIDNPDQRISEDINTFTGRSINFLLIFLGSIMQLVAFSAVLWSISHLLVGVLAVYALLGHRGRPLRLRQAADPPEFLAAAARGGFPLQPDAPARKRRIDRLLPRRSAGARAHRQQASTR